MGVWVWVGVCVCGGGGGGGGGGLCSQSFSHALLPHWSTTYHFTANVHVPWWCLLELSIFLLVLSRDCLEQCAMLTPTVLPLQL